MASFETHEDSFHAPRYQIVSFGDSQSDVGTYALVTTDFGGGRFTTNPGKVWPQVIARSYGNTLSAAYTGGFGTTLVANPTGNCLQSRVASSLLSERFILLTGSL